MNIKQPPKSDNKLREAIFSIADAKAETHARTLVPKLLEGARKALQEHGNLFDIDPNEVLRTNLGILTADPLDLRQWFLNGFPHAVLERKLSDIWARAARYLFFHPLTPNWSLKEADLKRYSNTAKTRKLTDAQKNALEVLRCVRALQGYFYSGKPVYETKKGIQYAPRFFESAPIPEHFPKGFTPALLEKRLKLKMSEFGLEIMLLTIASMKCDYHALIWPRAKRGIELSGKALMKRNSERQILSNQRKERVIELQKKLSKPTAGKLLIKLRDEPLFADWIAKADTKKKQKNLQRTINRYMNP